MLHDIDWLIPVESLASTIGLTLEQTHAFLDTLDEQLRPVGLLVPRLGNAVKLTRTHDAVSRDTLQRAWRAHLACRGLDIGQVQRLHQVRNGRLGKSLSNNQQVTVAD